MSHSMMLLSKMILNKIILSIMAPNIMITSIIILSMMIVHHSFLPQKELERVSSLLRELQKSLKIFLNESYDHPKAP